MCQDGLLITHYGTTSGAGTFVLQEQLCSSLACSVLLNTLHVCVVIYKP